MRKTGQSTRLIDYYIQELFNNPNTVIEIKDHYDTIKSNIRLTQLVLRRLYEEHSGDKFKIINQNTLKYVRVTE